MGKFTGQEMTSYFWMAGLSGGYGTHGDTFQNSADDSTEVRWWAKGGVLVGESPERIAFFRSIMEEAPVNEMDSGILPIMVIQENLNSNIYLFSKKGEYYLAYAAEKGQKLKSILQVMQIIRWTSLIPGICRSPQWKRNIQEKVSLNSRKNPIWQLGSLKIEDIRSHYIKAL